SFVLIKMDFQNLLFTFAEANPQILFIAFLCSVVFALWICIYKYKYILEFLGYNIDLDEVRTIKLGCLPLKLLSPLKSGEFFRAVYLNKNYNIPYRKGIYSITLGYLLRFLALFVIVLLGLLIRVLTFWQLILICVLIFALLTTIFSLKNFDMLFFSVLSEIFLILNCYIIFNAFNLQAGILDFLFFIPIVLLLEGLPISILGIGVRESALVLFFTNKMNYDGIIAAGITISFVNGLIPTILGLFFLKAFITKLTFIREKTCYENICITKQI
ncbi:MAG: lysylphosphatidylglycerol synthase domain-containing protein, partial [Elusimicrobiota bacterium]